MSFDADSTLPVCSSGMLFFLDFEFLFIIFPPLPFRIRTMAGAQKPELGDTMSVVPGLSDAVSGTEPKANIMMPFETKLLQYPFSSIFSTRCSARC